MSLSPKSDSIQFREVWADNLEEEFEFIRNIVDDYPNIAMDTEFPGTLIQPVGESSSSSDFQYKKLKLNVDISKLIQLGLTFSDEEGNLPPRDNKFCVWQFNFREFNPETDPHALESLALLRKSGIDFEKNMQKGICTRRFGELLVSSGVVSNDDVCWVTFHGAYDIGYLIKLLSRKKLPDTEEGFFELVSVYWPELYDVKHLMKLCYGLHGGLNKLAITLGVGRVGTSHLAGSDSLLTARTFKKLKDVHFGGSVKKYAGMLHGLNNKN